MKSLEERKADRKRRAEENAAERETSPATVKKTGEADGKKGKGGKGGKAGKTDEGAGGEGDNGGDNGGQGGAGWGAGSGGQ